MKCSDPELQRRLERMSAADVGVSPELKPVFALMDALDFYRHLDEPESPRFQEIIRLLISAELRPGLRRWYKEYGDSMNPAAVEFRDRLGELAGERFG